MSRRLVLVAATALAIAGAAVAAWRFAAPSAGTSGARAAAGAGSAQGACEPGPEIVCYPELELLDTAGDIWTRDMLAGKVVLVNYWATWCAPCVDEIPLLSEQARDHADSLVILGLLTEPVADDQLAAFAAEHGLEYPVIRVDAAIADAFGHPRGLPTTHVYDGSGRRRDSHLGPLTAAKLDDWLGDLLPR